ncbi:MAG: hypothetical protein EP332_01375 [Bacteroidetes bacterium]|nr:MAG: hypothetical protein EP332_01375 [Bacteroidota bacterium]
MNSRTLYSLLVLVGFFIVAFPVKAQDSTFIKVHFLYGSVPVDSFKEEEPEWFGGLLGGHVGIEIDTNRVLHFVPQGGLHIIGRVKKNFKSHFAQSDTTSFWGIFGTPADSVKRLSVEMKVSAKQKHDLDSIAIAYRSKVPYDYAFFGMRCASATYDVLSAAGILKYYHPKVNYPQHFYPALFRKKLLARAEDHQWDLYRREGTYRRKWEED